MAKKNKLKATKGGIFGHFYTMDDQSGTLFLDASAASTPPGSSPTAKNVSVVPGTNSAGKKTKTLKIAD